MNGENRVLSNSRGRAGSYGRTTLLIGVALIGAGWALGLGGCANLARADPSANASIKTPSPVIVEATEAARAPGSYPRFSAIPPVPSDVRPVGAWRMAVFGEWTLKHTVEADAAQIPFSLANSESWAQTERAQIPPSQMIPPASDSQAQSEAYAAVLRARATPPPSPN